MVDVKPIRKLVTDAPILLDFSFFRDVVTFNLFASCCSSTEEDFSASTKADMDGMGLVV